jgi:urate oxidase
MVKLTEQRYGKVQVRVLKILRANGRHTVCEIEVTVLLSGDFETSYTSGDNSKVVPTDTIKNTIHVLAKEQLGEELESFAVIVGQYFLRRYKQMREALVEIAERVWGRLEIDGRPHPHSFYDAGAARKFTRVICTAQSCEVQGGMRDLVILKSTGSGFENYPKGEYTTLPETADRILATSLSGTWRFANAPGSYRGTNANILLAILKVFEENFSPSAQTTLFQMAEAALAICPEISQIDLSMPNKHYLPINLAPFGLENKNEVFVPTDEPFGLIEASVTRDD